MSYLISHPSVAPFVQQAARALHEGGLLSEFHTTLHDDPGSLAQQIGAAACRLVGYDLQRELRRRAVTEVPLDRVRGHPFREIVRLAAGKISPSSPRNDAIWEWAEHSFDRKVARRLPKGLTGIYGYEHCAEYTFEAAKRRGLRIICDMPAPEPVSVRRMLDQEVAAFPQLNTSFRQQANDRDEDRSRRRRAEWAMADVVVVASQFTRDSFEAAGLDCGKIRIVPYGAPPAEAAEVALAPRKEGPLRLVWAGTFSVRKGAHYLVNAWRRHSLGSNATLSVYGTNDLPASLIEPLPAGIHFHGPIPRDELMGRYAGADALLFPTLCDGFGMVVSEAWSRGCPVITTRCAGASDLLKHGYNGLLIDARSEEAIAEIVERYSRDPAALSSMRQGALATAAGWQWADYRARLLREIRNPAPGS